MKQKNRQKAGQLLLVGLVLLALAAGEIAAAAQAVPATQVLPPLPLYPHPADPRLRAENRRLCCRAGGMVGDQL